MSFNHEIIEAQITDFVSKIDKAVAADNSLIIVEVPEGDGHDMFVAASTEKEVDIMRMLSNAYVTAVKSFVKNRSGHLNDPPSEEEMADIITEVASEGVINSLKTQGVCSKSLEEEINDSPVH